MIAREGGAGRGLCPGMQRRSCVTLAAVACPASPVRGCSGEGVARARRAARSGFFASASLRLCDLGVREGKGCVGQPSSREGAVCRRYGSLSVCCRKKEFRRAIVSE